MSTGGRDDHAHVDELEAFRREAAALGFDDGQDVDEARLESADDFIARMRSAAGDERPSSRRRARRVVAAVLAVAAGVAVFFGVAHRQDAAVAESLPSLDYEFASAVRIAYAGGEDPRTTLDSLAAAADADAADPDEGSGAVQYKQSDSWFAEVDEDGSSSIVPRVREAWLAPDGSLTTRETLGAPLRADGRGAAPVRPDRPDAVDERLPAGTVDADFARSLPTSPARLADALLDHIECESRAVGPVRSMCLYREVVSLFETHVVSPELAAATWRMLRDEQGFVSLGSVKDRAGRAGLGLSIIDPENGRYRYILIGDPSDGQMLGVEEILIKDDPSLDAKAPTVTAFTAFLESRYVKDVPAG
ncbi:CU044_5270 family protein [Aeromicrobium endophyticum]|uniref:CU044_5270 family protein n=1 Tax=Aeromicrobium endophyticum TaxID=2292704 RepID=A0A371P9Q8_9ACTN|nr:CU044_5270 family protein [Aeromicrobium endophyticum]REK72693.1 hypothetical protein DX116_03555 [Aeromicrobium endophyticum]